MITTKCSRVIFVLLVISLGLNAVFFGFVFTATKALANPQYAIESRLESVINSLPEKYKPLVQARYNTFHEQFMPLFEEVKKERKLFISLLLASPVDVKQAQAQGEKLRMLTIKMQEAIQSAIIDIAANLPTEEKTKIIDNSRILKVITQ